MSICRSPDLNGETLAARLLKGALPLDQVLRDSIEIADAHYKAYANVMPVLSPTERM